MKYKLAWGPRLLASFTKLFCEGKTEPVEIAFITSPLLFTSYQASLVQCTGFRQTPTSEGRPCKGIQLDISLWIMKLLQFIKLESLLHLTTLTCLNSIIQALISSAHDQQLSTANAAIVAGFLNDKLYYWPAEHSSDGRTRSVRQAVQQAFRKQAGQTTNVSFAALTSTRCCTD